MRLRSVQVVVPVEIHSLDATSRNGIRSAVETALDRDIQAVAVKVRGFILDQVSDLLAKKKACLRLRHRAVQRDVSFDEPSRVF